MQEQRPELANKQLRLIHSGRMLAGHTPLSMLRSAQSMAIKDEKFEGLSRLSLSLPAGWLQETPKETLEAAEDKDSVLGNRVWLHCAVTNAEVNDSGEHDSAGGDPVRPNPPRLSKSLRNSIGLHPVNQMGSATPQAYDRFTDAGLSSADVQAIRALFRRVMFGSTATSGSEGDSSGANGNAIAPAGGTCSQAFASHHLLD
jgi:hypothetical protein